MRRIHFVSVVAMGLCAVWWAAGWDVAPRAAGDETQEVDLLTAQDAAGQLAGWEFYAEEEGTKTDAVWTLRDGVLSCRGTPRGYLYTTRDYLNFVLRLEWRRLPDQEPGKAGVLVRMTGAHKIWPKSLEAQLNAGQAGDFWGLDGYALQGPAERSQSVQSAQFGTLTNLRKLVDAEKPPGEWNAYEISAQDATVTLRINGQLVNRATQCDVVPGRICLTSEGDAIEFRRVRLIGASPSPAGT